MWIFYYYHYCQSGAVQGNIPDGILAVSWVFFNGAKNNNDTVFNPRGRRPRPSATSWRPSSSTPPRETATCITVSARLRMFHETLTRPRSDLAFGNRTHMRLHKSRNFLRRLRRCDQPRSSAGTGPLKKTDQRRGWFPLIVFFNLAEIWNVHALGVSRLTSSEKPRGFGSRRPRTDVITRLLLNPGLRNSLLSRKLP